MLHIINDEELKDVSGGYIYDTGTIAFDRNGNGYHKYEAIDDKTGAIIQIAKSYREAFDIAEQHNVSTAGISLDQINRLRETGSLD